MTIYRTAKALSLSLFLCSHRNQKALMLYQSIVPASSHTVYFFTSSIYYAFAPTIPAACINDVQRYWNTCPLRWQKRRERRTLVIIGDSLIRCSIQRAFLFSIKTIEISENITGLYRYRGGFFFFFFFF